MEHRTAGESGVPGEEIAARYFSFLTEAGFSYEYVYDKGSDSSCVYIMRFRKGRDFLDLRTVSGGKERNVVVFSGGGYLFPDLPGRHKKLAGAFRRKHLFRRPTEEELYALEAELLKAEIENGKLFGIPLR